jgi:hypothetical protein
MYISFRNSASLARTSLLLGCGLPQVYDEAGSDILGLIVVHAYAAERQRIPTEAALHSSQPQ